MIDSISFCVINFNGKKANTLRCVESVLRQRVDNKEILLFGADADLDCVKVLDDGSSPALNNLNAIRNFMVDSSSKDYVVFLDADIELNDDWYDNIKQTDCFDLIGARLVNPDGARCVDWAYRFPLGERKLPLPLRYDEWTTKAYVSGSLMVVRRTVFDKINFDKSITSDGDSDFCLRASGIGHRIGVNPSACAVYHGAHMSDSPTQSPLFDKSVKIFTEYQSSLKLGNAAFEQKNYNKAISSLSKIASIAPSDSSTLGKLGWAYYFKGRYDESKTVFEKCVEADPANHDCLRGLGWAHLQTGRLDESVGYFRRAFDTVSPENWGEWLETTTGLGWAYYNKGDYRQAIDTFKTVVKEHKTSGRKEVLSGVFNGLGWAHLSCEEFDDARKYFELLLKGGDCATNEETRRARRGLAFAKQKKPGCHLSREPSPPGLAAGAPTFFLKVFSKIKAKLANALS